MRKKVVIIFILLYVTGFAEIIMGPYLQAVKTDSICVLVECNSNDAVIVEYGVNGSYDNFVSTEDVSTTTLTTYVHRVKLSGLKPNTLYNYRALQGKSKSLGYNFRTAVNEGTSFRFAWMADCRTGTDIHDIISMRIKKEKPYFSLYGGDLCSGGSYESFKNEFFRKNELELIAEVPFFNTVGNHEGNTKNTIAFTQSPLSASSSNRYYSFDYGDLHVLVLNTEMPFYPDSPQYKFAEKNLAATRKIWKVVTSHVPVYCCGDYGDNKRLIYMANNVFEPNKVDIVISGHSHFYQHNLVNGIHYMIIGSAGAPLAEPKDDCSYVIKSLRDYNYAIVDVSPTNFHMVVYNAEGSIIDTIDLKK